MASRRKAREAALQVLYFIETSGTSGAEALDLFFKHFNASEDNRDFCEDVVTGVERHRKEIDELITKYSENWKLSRMDVVDRNILRLAVYELIYRDDIPAKVTLNEAVEMGKKYGSENSGAFINGILDRINRECCGQ